MGPDQVTTGTEEYCFAGLSNPVEIPADIPEFQVYDAARDILFEKYFKSPTRDRLGRIIKNRKVWVIKFRKITKNNLLYKARIGDEEYNAIYYNRYSSKPV